MLAGESRGRRKRTSTNFGCRCCNALLLDVQVLSALARHSEHSEERLAAFEKRIGEMLSQQRDETRRAIDGMP